MAFTTPRTWDGTETANVATYLEAHRTNNIDLAGRLSQINRGFEGAKLNGSGTGGQKIWYYQHRLRYLHYHLQTANDNVTAAHIYVTTDTSVVGVDRVSHGGSYSNDTIMSSSGGDGGSAIDLSGLTVGTWYYIIVRLDGTGAQLYVLNLEESSEP